MSPALAGSQAHLKQRLIAMVRASPALMAALAAACALELDSWCIGAGAVRTLVWDTLHDFQTPTPLDDVDLVYYEQAAIPGRDAALEQALRLALPALRWDVTNQATVHDWFSEQLGQEVAPLLSLEDGVATWPEYATCVGVRLHANDVISVIAPHGLEDLFAPRVRHNPVRADAATYRQRVLAKRFAERWPSVSIFPASGK